MDNMLELFIRGAVIGTIAVGVPALLKLGKKKKTESIDNGKVYYGLLYNRILAFYLAGILCGDVVLMVLLGNSIEGIIAFLMVLISGVPFAILFTHLYKKNFIKKYLKNTTIQ